MQNGGTSPNFSQPVSNLQCRFMHLLSQSRLGNMVLGQLRPGSGTGSKIGGRNSSMLAGLAAFGRHSVTVKGAKKDIGISGIKLGVGETLSDEDFSLLGPDSKP